MTACHARPATLAFAASLALVRAAFAQNSSPEQQDSPQSVIVRGSSASAAGGQIARDAHVGVLGDEDTMRTPFAVTSYTGEFVQDKQARNVADVLQEDPGVRIARGFGNFQESYFIRGFVLSSDDVAWNGLYGLLPRQTVASALFDRVEVLHGASAFLTGAAPGGDAIGGSINLTSKRAPANALTQFSVGDASGSQAMVAADLARRFGPENAGGLRLSVSRRDGGTGVDEENIETTAGMLGADWSTAGARLSLDIGHQDNRLERSRTNVTLAANAGSVPSAPDASRNWAQPWTYSNERDNFGALRAEFDVGATATAWLSAGLRRSTEANSLANLTVTNGTTGSGTTYRFDNVRQDDVATGEVGVRGIVTTGFVKHTLLATGSTFRDETRNAYGFSTVNGLITGLYDPVVAQEPALVRFGNALADPGRTAATTLVSFAAADTMSFQNDLVLLTVGLRRQRFDVRSWAYNTGVESAPYEAAHTSPLIAAVLRLTPQLSAYANAIESLARGDTAPSTAANLGAQLAPYVSRQREVGVKFSGGDLGATAAWFTTSRPRAALDSNNVFNTVGHDRHQGVELTAFGQVTPTLTLISGITWLDARQQDTGSTSTEGRRVIGVPQFQGNVDLDWRVTWVQGLSLNSRVVATGKVYADAANLLAVPGWTRIDLGTRYATRILGHALTLRASVNNVAGKSYWSSAGGTPGSGYLVLGSPRTVTASATLDF